MHDARRIGMVLLLSVVLGAGWAVITGQAWIGVGIAVTVLAVHLHPAMRRDSVIERSLLVSVVIATAHLYLHPT
jgi:hypothetical protein